ncbi:MAG TPA: hypothetical protein P5228_00015 [Bacteroidales bacterium]|nr:hypothetical protein [Bacteroidales bacterium]HRZ48512.1 hypothetical protein [Bacteroidales bacterium]
MKIVRVSTRDDLQSFARCGSDFAQHYGESFPKSVGSELRLWDPACNFFFGQQSEAIALLAVDGDVVLGRIAVFRHPMLTDSEPGTGLLGMFESAERDDVATALLTEGCTILRGWGCNRVAGPVDFSIWHQYRFMTKGFGSYVLMGEPRNPEWYPLFWQQFGFTAAHHWTTFIYDHTALQPLPETLRTHEALFRRLGYHSVLLTGMDDQILMHQVHALLMPSYRTFPFYTPLTAEEFVKHYHYMPSLISKNTSFLLKNQLGEIMGFSLQYRDLNRAFKAMGTGTGFTSKLRFWLNRNKEEVAIIAQGGTTTHHSREAVELGLEKEGTPLSLGKVGLARSIQLSVDVEKYSAYAITLVRDEALHRKNIPQNTVETREYALFAMAL